MSDTAAVGQSGSRYWAISVALVTAGALVLRLHHLGHDSFWIDEINVVTTARAGGVLASLRDRLGPLDPPGSYLLIAASLHLPFALETTARLPAALAGALEAAAAAWAVRALTRRPDAALVACIAVAVGPFTVRYSQEAHYYSMFSAIHLLSWWALVRALRGERRWRWWGAITAIALYIHVFAWIVLAVQLAVVVGAALWLRRTRPDHGVEPLRLRRPLTAAACAGLAVLPWAAYEANFWLWGGTQRRLGINAPHSQTVPYNLDLIRRTISWTLGNDGHLGSLALTLGLLAVLSPLLAPSRARGAAIGVVAYFLIVVTVLVPLARLDGTYFAMRRVEFLGPVLIVAAALSIVGLAERTAQWTRLAWSTDLVVGTAAALLVVASLQSVARYDRSTKTDWRAAAALIKGAPPGALVVIGPFSPNWYPAIEHYLHWEGVTRPVVHVSDVTAHEPLPTEVVWVTGSRPRTAGLDTEGITTPPRAQVIAGDAGWGQINLLVFVSRSTPTSLADLDRQRAAVATLRWTIPAS